MSKYAENNLQSGEEIIIKAKINFLAAMANLIWAVICIVGDVMLQSKKADIMTALSGGEKYVNTFFNISNAFLLIIGLLPLVLKIITLLFAEIAVTNKRVIGKTGIIAVKSTDLHIDKVDNVTIKTTFWGRIFRFYTLIIKGSGDGEGIPYKGISNANEIKNAINATIEQHAEEARRAQAEEIAMAMNAGSRYDRR